MLKRETSDFNLSGHSVTTVDISVSVAGGYARPDPQQLVQRERGQRMMMDSEGDKYQVKLHGGSMKWG